LARKRLHQGRHKIGNSIEVIAMKLVAIDLRFTLAQLTLSR
jgi:hypothetical protein